MVYPRLDRLLKYQIEPVLREWNKTISSSDLRCKIRRV